MSLAQLISRDRAVAMDPEDLALLVLDDLLRTDPQNRTRRAYITISANGWQPVLVGQTVGRTSDEIRGADPGAWEALEEA